jgi:hypothetical protein
MRIPSEAMLVFLVEMPLISGETALQMTSFLKTIFMVFFSFYER